MSPEALDSGPLARLRDGDVLSLDADAGTLNVQLSEAEFAARLPEMPSLDADTVQFHSTLGRGLFDSFRHVSTSAKAGATSF